MTVSALRVLTAMAAIGSGSLGLAATPNAPPSGTQIVRLDPALDRLIAPGARIERIATGFKFNEGPMWRSGRLWFSDLGDNKMYAVSADGRVELLIDRSGVQQGGLKIVRVNQDLHLTPFLDSYAGKKLNSPNDLVFAPDGALWFTDPPFGLAGNDQDPAKELEFNGVFRYANGVLTPMITDLTLPNGIGFSPDGKTLYVSNYGPKMYVNAYDVGRDGKLSNSRTLIEYADDSTGQGGPDGLKVDTAARA